MKPVLVASCFMASAIGLAGAALPLPPTKLFKAIFAEGANPAGRQGFEIRQAPVPLHVPARAAFQPAPHGVVGAETKLQERDEMGRDKEGERVAQAAIEADGYKGVRDLHKVREGFWRARALRGNTLVGLSVDRAGNVAAD